MTALASWLSAHSSARCILLVGVKPALSFPHVLRGVLPVKADPIYCRSEVPESEMNVPATDLYISPEVLQFVDDTVKNER